MSYSVKLYTKLIKIHIKSAFQYKLSFLTELLGVVLGYIGNIIIYGIMFKSFHDLNGWSFWQIMFVYTYAMVAVNISNIFFSHFIQVDNEVISGEFDKYLIRPIGSFKYYLISKFNVSQFVSIFIGVAIFVKSAVQISFTYDFINVCKLIICLTGSVLINSACMVIVGAIAFWTKKSQEIYDSILWPAQYLTFLPLSIFPKVIRWSFTYIIPLAFLSFYTASMFLEMENGNVNIKAYGMSTLFVGVIFFLISYFIWEVGVKKYEGSGN